MDFDGCYYDRNGNASGWVHLSKNGLTFDMFDYDQMYIRSGENKFYKNLNTCEVGTNQNK